MMNQKKNLGNTAPKNLHIKNVFPTLLRKHLYVPSQLANNEKTIYHM